MKSIWTETAALPEFEPLCGDTETDVLVIGGGIAGILIAHELKESGPRCLLVEAKRLCRGVTANTTAKITSQHGLIYNRLLRQFGPELARGYWLANEEALRRYEELAWKIQCDFERRDAFIYSVDKPGALEQELGALQQLGIPADFVQETELPIKTVGAVRFRNQAQFHPLKLLAAIAQQLNVCEHTPVREFEKGAVLTDGGKITARHIVVATHFPILNKHGSYFLKMHQNRSYVLALENTPEINGMYLDEAEGGLSFRSHGGTLLLGGGAHRTGKPGEGWAGLEAFSRAHYPGASEVARWATQDCMSLDHVPYIGRYSRRTHNLYVVSGFNKWGMTSAMVAACLLRDMIQGRESPFERVFSPSRSMLRRELLDNALEAAKSLVTISGPRCPHMGCALKWNRQERSWDCPCHGSRFANDGKLLDGPATGDLKKKK